MGGLAPEQHANNDQDYQQPEESHLSRMLLRTRVVVESDYRGNHKVMGRRHKPLMKSWENDIFSGGRFRMLEFLLVYL